MNDIKHNVAEIKRLFQKRKEAMKALSRFLLSKGIAPRIVEEILLDIAQEEKELGGVKEAVAKRIRTASSNRLGRTKKIALVGPTGVGKSTTIANLQKLYEGKDLSFIDTGGCPIYQKESIDALGETLVDHGEDVEILLTLSATSKELDLYGAIHQFSPLCPTGLVFTKLDETLTAGVIVNISVKSDLPIQYITYKTETYLADPEFITHKILTDLNEEEFQFLRQLML